MARQRLDYAAAGLHKITKEENPAAFKAKQFVVKGTGEIISGAKARKLAGSQAPSRMTKAEKAKAAETPKLPKGMLPKEQRIISKTQRYERRDERALGIDSDPGRAMTEAIKNFEADHGTKGLSPESAAFIDHPNYASILDQYAGGTGWSSDQWLSGMSNVRNIRITNINGDIFIEFEADFDIDGESGEIGTRTVKAAF